MFNYFIFRLCIPYYSLKAYIYENELLQINTMLILLSSLNIKIKRNKRRMILLLQVDDNSGKEKLMKKKEERKYKRIK